MPSQQKAHTHVKKKKSSTYDFHLFLKSFYRTNSSLSTLFYNNYFETYFGLQKHLKKCFKCPTYLITFN